MKKLLIWAAVIGFVVGATISYVLDHDPCQRGRDDLKFMEICSVTPGCTYSMQDFKRTAKDLNSCPNGIQGEIREQPTKEKKDANI